MLTQFSGFLVPIVCLMVAGCGSDSNDEPVADGRGGASDGGAAGGGASGTVAPGAGGASGSGSTTQWSYPEPAEDYAKEAFFDDFDGNELDESVWQIATWSEHGGQTGSARCTVEDGHLKMVLINDASAGVLSSAIQTRDEFYYGRWEARLKASSCPNVLNSFYTIDWDDTSSSASTSDGTKQEIDIELLSKSFTGNDGRVHFALHADGLDSSDTNPDLELGFDPSADFHVFGYDITPEGIEWFVDDRVVWSVRYDENPITIDAPYMLKLNFWTGGNWVLGPPPEGMECVYLIDWIRFTPHLNG